MIIRFGGFSIITTISLWLANVSCVFSMLRTASMSKFDVVILGGGIHGASLAYFLSKKGVTTLIIERSSVAAAASGKSGGFLAKNWGNRQTTELHIKSFELHKELAKDLQLTSYRPVQALSVNGNPGPNVASWLDRAATSAIMDEECAQVNPFELTQALLSDATQYGTKVLIGHAVGCKVESGSVVGVLVDGYGLIETSKVCICLGPWSGVFCEDAFQIHLPMEGIKSTSLVFKNVEPLRTEPFGCFCEEDRNGCHLELYSRVGEELYVCGCGGSDYVSGDRLRAGGDCESAEQVEADPSRIAAAISSLRAMTSIGDAPPSITQACMRPCTPDALPVMGAIPGVEGAYISAGHNCWGILWAPASGQAMSELILDGSSRLIDLSPFDPSRFMASSQKRGRKKGTAAVGEQW